ncbi:ADP-ribosylglycohydrolase family protein, partial [Romboutsia sp.]|uniref:ADP-ribosylglycohydrolase family protein n=1 Tax=Romboutsia sp. TaxID=1965302 RepID=UPI002C9F5A08
MESYIRDKFVGSLLWAIIGDALGWPNEQNSNRIKNNAKEIDSNNFVNWEKRCGGRFYPYMDRIEAGSYSDDGQLLISTARSLVSSNEWFTCFTRIELPFWLLYERGGGGATLRASKHWLEGKSPWESEDKEKYFNAGGNGAAMRILPHVIYNIDDEMEGMTQVFMNSITTHGNPRAILGSLLYSKALYYLFKANETIKYGELIDYLIETKDNWSIVPQVDRLESWNRAVDSVYKGKYIELWNKTVDETINLLY